MKNKIDRVLIIAPTPFFADRGCHVHIAEQALALKRLGKKVLIVTYGIGGDFENLPTKRTIKFPWYSKESIGPSWHKFYVDIFLFFTALKAARKFKPDIIHGHLHEGCLIGYLVSGLTGVGLVFDCQGSLTGELVAHKFPLSNNKLLRKIWYAIEKKIDNLANAVIVQSSEMYQEIVNQFGVPANKVFMAFDGVSTHFFKPKQKNDTLRSSLKIPPNRQIIVYLGGLSPHKGANTLLNSFVHIKRQMPNTYLLLMGYPNEGVYKKTAIKLGISESVSITGRVDYKNAPAYLSLGDVAVAPKRTQTEANGKVYHYMAAGLPTVAFDTVVNRDILGDLGVYVSAKESGLNVKSGLKIAEKLSSTIVDLLQDSVKLKKIGSKVRQEAINKYSWDNVAGRILKAYQYAYLPWQLQVFNVSIRKKEKWLWAKLKINKILDEDSKCLDIGSGVGTLSILQERLGGEWEFSETDKEAAVETEDIVQGYVHQGDIYDQALNNKKYDLITIFDVIEHVDAPLKFLKRAETMLKPTGSLILTTPADDGSFYLWRRLAHWIFGIDKQAHNHKVEGFSKNELSELCNKSKLQITHLDQFSYTFTELVELIYNGAYIIKNRSKQTTSGYNVSLSPASQADITRNKLQLNVLRVVYPLLRAVSLIDHQLSVGKGYELGVVIKKRRVDN